MFFSNKKKKDLFDARQRQIRVSSILRRVIDMNTPNLMPMDNSARCSERVNRCLPVLGARWDGEHCDRKTLIFGVSKDISDYGISVVLPQDVHWSDIVVGLWIDRLCFLEGTIRRRRPFGGKMWEIGIEISDVLDDHSIREQLGDDCQHLQLADEMCVT